MQSSWSKQKNITTAIYNTFHHHWPFNMLAQNERTVATHSDIATFERNYDMPEGDSLLPRVVAFTQVITLSDVENYNRHFDDFVRVDCRKQQHYEERADADQSFLNSDRVGYIDYGFAFFKDQSHFKNFRSLGLKTGSSFIQLTFYFELTDDMCLEFDRILRKYHRPETYFWKSNLLALVKISIHQHLETIHIRQREIFNYFERLRQSIINLLYRKNLMFHIGDDDSLSMISFVSFVRKEPNENAQGRNGVDFWRMFLEPDPFVYKNSNDTLRFPDEVNTPHALGAVSKIILLDEDKLGVPNGFGSFGHYCMHLSESFGHGLIFGLATSGVLGYYFRSLNSFRKKYLESRIGLSFAKRFSDFKRSSYFVDLFAKEVSTASNDHYHDEVSLSRSHGTHTESLVTLLSDENSKAVDSLDQLSNFLEKSLSDFFSIKTVKSNSRIQLLFLGFTLISLAIGLVQVFGSSELSGYVNMLMNTIIAFFMKWFS